MKNHIFQKKEAKYIQVIPKLVMQINHETCKNHTEFIKLEKTSDRQAQPMTE